MEHETTLDQELFTSGRHEVTSLSVTSFLFLNIISFGLYEIWWHYKMWSHYKEREALDILPAARAIFAIFFIYSLFEKIKNDANMQGVEARFSSGLLFIGWLVMNLSSKMPDPFWMVSLLSVLIYIPVLSAFNAAIDASDEYSLHTPGGFSTGQIVIIIIGVIFWGLVLAGYLLPVDPDTTIYDGY